MKMETGATPVLRRRTYLAAAFTHSRWRRSPNHRPAGCAGTARLVAPAEPQPKRSADILVGQCVQTGIAPTKMSALHFGCGCGSAGASPYQPSPGF